jgi:hypothetical protein
MFIAVFVPLWDCTHIWDFDHTTNLETLRALGVA